MRLLICQAMIRREDKPLQLSAVCN